MRYIQELREGSSVKDIYLCKKRMALVTKNGKNYESLTLQDKTGTIDAKIWDPNSMGIGEFEELEMDFNESGSYAVQSLSRDICSSMSRERESAMRESMILRTMYLSPTRTLTI